FARADAVVPIADEQGGDHDRDEQRIAQVNHAAEYKAAAARGATKARRSSVEAYRRAPAPRSAGPPPRGAGAASPRRRSSAPHAERPRPSSLDRHDDTADRPEHGILSAAEVPHPAPFRVSPRRPRGDEQKGGRETRRPCGEDVEDEPDRHDDLDREGGVKPGRRRLEPRLRHERFDEVLVLELHDQVRDEIDAAQDPEHIESRHVENRVHRRNAPSESAAVAGGPELGRQAGRDVARSRAAASSRYRTLAGTVNVIEKNDVNSGTVGRARYAFPAGRIDEDPTNDNNTAIASSPAASSIDARSRARRVRDPRARYRQRAAPGAAGPRLQGRHRR